MSKLFPILMAVVCLMCSCEKATDSASPESSTPSNSKQVQFVMKGITEEFSTRATISSAGCTDLYVFEGTTLLAHKVSTDADFDAPFVNLTYGSHDLTFIASSSDGQTWQNGVWSCTKVVAVFSTTMTVTVSSNSSKSRQVQLTRRNSRLKILTTDNVPTSVTKCHMRVGNYLSLQSSLVATGAAPRDVTVDITSNQGTSLTMFMNVLTQSLTDEEEVPVLVEFLDATDKVLYKYERTSKLKSNRCVVLTGDYFGGSTNDIVITTTTFDEVTQNLFD